jgi:phosphoglycolate phosphatase
MNLPALVVFDLDGTLVDTRADIVASANAALVAVGLPPREGDLIASYVGNGSRILVSRALGPEHQDKLDVAVEAFFAHYGEHLLVHSRLYPGIAELLEELERRDVAMVVCTNKPGKFARPLLAGLEVARRFRFIHGWGDTKAQKPDPGGVFELCRLTGVEVAKAVLVGDSRIDVETGRNANMPTFAVTWGFGSEQELRDANATRLIRTASELQAALLPTKE